MYTTWLVHHMHMATTRGYCARGGARGGSAHGGGAHGGGACGSGGCGGGAGCSGGQSDACHPPPKLSAKACQQTRACIGMHTSHRRRCWPNAVPLHLLCPSTTREHEHVGAAPCFGARPRGLSPRARCAHRTPFSLLCGECALCSSALECVQSMVLVGRGDSAGGTLLDTAPGRARGRFRPAVVPRITV